MSTVNPVAATIQSTAKTFLNIIVFDALSTGGTPVITFLAAFGSAAGDPIKIKAACAAFLGEEVGELPSFEALVSSQLANFLTEKVKAEMAKVPAPAA